MYDILFTLEVPLYHACDESDEGLGLLSIEHAPFNCVFLLRHQSSDSYEWPLSKTGMFHAQYAVYKCDSANPPIERGAHELDLSSLLGVADPDAIFTGSCADCMARFNELQTQLEMEMYRHLCLHRDERTYTAQLEQVVLKTVRYTKYMSDRAKEVVDRFNHYAEKVSGAIDDHLCLVPLGYKSTLQDFLDEGTYEYTSQNPVFGELKEVLDDLCDAAHPYHNSQWENDILTIFYH